MGIPLEVDDLTYVRLYRLYAHQSRSIDGGNAAAWAATFTPDGVFASPSYPEPARGTADLVSFAQRYADQARDRGTVSRHVVTNIDVVTGPDDRSRTVHAYLQIVDTPRGEPSRLARMTTIEDAVVPDESSPFGWLVERRVVRRDDEGPEAVLAQDPS